jgi:GntR family transcriptional regulator
LDIILSNSSGKPIYEQISLQIKDLVLTEQLAAGQQLPSIRALANDLRISAITTKRAYADLEAEGFIETTPGKGSFIAGGNAALLREERLKRVESLLAEAAREARGARITGAELHDMIDLILENEDER